MLHALELPWICHASAIDFGHDSPPPCPDAESGFWLPAPAWSVAPALSAEPAVVDDPGWVVRLTNSGWGATSSSAALVPPEPDPEPEPSEDPPVDPSTLSTSVIR